MITAIFIFLMERGLIPDGLVRWGIRQLCHRRLASLKDFSTADYAEELKRHSVAEEPKAANEQHYELPPAFFNMVLGKNRKYSCAFWPEGCENLDEAETEALRTTMDRAELEDGMSILELGCGWGSLTLAMAERYPNSTIFAISNSRPQREFITAEAQRRGFKNVQILTRDLGRTEDLGVTNTFDRIVSVEMFEHVRNYEVFFRRISQWLKPGGKLFVHVFTHKKHAYLFESENTDDWMAKYFFTGGQMPSADLFKYFQKDLNLLRQWDWEGVHYQKTSEAWLQNLDRHREDVMRIFKQVYGAEADRWLRRWRVFFIACAEVFGFRQGHEWGVNHYLFTKRTEG